MIKITLRISKTFMLGAFLALAASLHAEEKGGLAEQFENPPDEYRSGVKWEWCNGMINKEGATADLEAMKRVGLGGGKIFNVGGVEGPVRFASEEWYEIVAHSLREADRLGLQLGLNMTEGFTGLGGPWITPEKSMQYVVWSETEVTGPGPVSIALEKPDDGPIKAKTLKLDDVGFYRDIKVFAVPQVGTGRIKDFELKSGLGHHPDPEEVAAKTPEGSIPASDMISRSDVIDVTDRMDENGKLKWDAPAGKWTILRMGAASTGACTRPGSEKTRGLEADKLSREAVKFHFDTFGKPLLEMDGVKPGENLIFFAVDSWEADAQNWSPVLPAEFEERCGYSLYPFLPVLTGRVVENIDVSERFLWDYRRTIADCIHDNFYAYMAELCRQAGVTFSSEPFTRAAFDGMETTEAVGIPTATFWQGPGSWSRAHKEGKWASSAAHVTGKKKVSSEAFPAGGIEAGWVHYPWTYKWLGDFAYASGINHFSFHCFPLQPWDDKVVHKPGMIFKNWGSQYSRHNTWWEQGVDWQKYQSRCQFMLQQGTFQAEALMMTPESVPGAELKGNFSPFPLGYDWDVASAQMVREKLTVKDGMICAPSGMKYRLLVLPRISDISVPLLKKLKALVADGARVVVSSRPKMSRGLENYPASKKEVTDIVSGMWQKLDGKKVKEQPYGKGKLYWNRPEEVLKKLGVEPDVIVEAEGENRGKFPINYIHRTTPEAEIYFVSSSSEKISSGLLSFRVSGKQPEFWHPDTGRIEACPVYEQKDGRTVVPMVFDPAGSVFVVFRDKTAAPSVTKVSLDGKAVLSTSERINPFSVAKEFFTSGGVLSLETSDQRTVEQTIPAPYVRSMDTDWTVSFDGVGTPAKTRFKTLTPWDEHPDEAIRYFSGTGTYRKTFDMRKKEDQRVWLDIGKVEVIATVIVNGEDLGVQWKPPFLVDITDAVRSGKNTLEIQVTNLWVNRLIGDEQFPDDVSFSSKGLLGELPEWFVNNTPRPEKGRKTFTTCKYYKGTDPLMPSGLVGPVSLITMSENPDPLIERITRDLFTFSRNPNLLSYGRHRETTSERGR